MNEEINIIFPNQLFQNSEIIQNKKDTYIIEENLFFNQYKFHKHKIAYHRSSMQKYKDYLISKDINVIYIDSQDKLSDIRNFIKQNYKNLKKINLYDPVDNWLLKRLNLYSKNIELIFFENPLFLNASINQSDDFFRHDKKKFSHAIFYKEQRKKYNILMVDRKNPLGGKFSFDTENRKKYPKNKIPPKIDYPCTDDYWKEAVSYVDKYFNDNPGFLPNDQIYPNDFNQSNAWFMNFLEQRFSEFGDFEDAIVNDKVFLNHSILTPMLNTGLISPKYIINSVIKFGEKNNIPINSLEGFVRQIIGWREFIKEMYICKGTFSRTNNFWNYSRKIPDSFYDGSTGIVPFDDSIKKVLKYSYSHHIERLMIIGNFMLLCEINPDDVYKWFMELYIDAYDWVMVPNVYGMSQFADGGLFATKPYISSSNYIKKMSNYKSGEWDKIWDGLYWNFINKNSNFFKSNPRLSMMHHLFNRMDVNKQKTHIEVAENFLGNL